MYQFGNWSLWLALLLFPVLAHAEIFTFKSESIPSDMTATIGGELSFPKGDGPFPVAVLLHPCGGLDSIGRATLQAHAKEMTSIGFASLMLDSYGPRNLANGKACDTIPTGTLRRDDAFNAMTALQRHAKISKDNIFLLGLSDGANAALLSARGAAIGQFRAIAAYYPGCDRMLGGVSYVHKSPTIVFVGEKDDWTPPAACIKARQSGAVSGAEFEVISYPTAHHGFDQSGATRAYKGHTLAYDRDATIDSRKRVKEFFIRHLTAEMKAMAPFAGKAR